MELFFFILLAGIMVAFIALGLKSGNFPLTLLGAVLCISLGGLALSTSITTEKIVDYDFLDPGDGTMKLTPNYQSFSATSETNIWVLGNLMFFGGIVFLLFTVYYAFVGVTGAPEETWGL